MSVTTAKVGDGETYEFREGLHDPEVTAWRREQFDQLGFDDTRAEALARLPSNEADLGTVRRMIRVLGYTQEQVWRLVV